MHSDLKIVLSTADTIHFIPVNDIFFCKSNNSYTTFYCKNQAPLVISQNIKEFEKTLSTYGFFRPHQSYLVNLSHVQQIDKTHGYTLILSNKSQIPTSTRKKKELMQILRKKLRFQTK